MKWNSKDTAPKDGSWILVRNGENHPFTVRWVTPFLAAPELSDWRDEHGKVRMFTAWKEI